MGAHGDRGVKLAHCIACGCHDMAACHDEATGGPCSWLAVDRDEGKGVCSACPEALTRWNKGDRAFAVPVEQTEGGEPSLDQAQGGTWLTDCGNRAGTAHLYTSQREGMLVAHCGREILPSDRQGEQQALSRCKRCARVMLAADQQQIRELGSA